MVNASTLTVFGDTFSGMSIQWSRIPGDGEQRQEVFALPFLPAENWSSGNWRAVRYACPEVAFGGASKK